MYAFFFPFCLNIPEYLRGTLFSEKVVYSSSSFDKILQRPSSLHQVSSVPISNLSGLYSYTQG